MFFLRSTTQGLATVSPYSPFIVALREDCASKGSGISRVVAELGCVVHSSTTTIRQRAEGILALGSVRTDDSNSVLRHAADELFSPLNVLAASALISHNDISVLPLFEEAAQRSSILEVKDHNYSLSLNLGVALEEVRDQAAIPSLTRLMEASDAGTRRGAAQALRNIGTEAAIQPLAKRLHDVEWGGRWLSVMGLAGTEHN